jgi:hypothetical protein
MGTTRGLLSFFARSCAHTGGPSSWWQRRPSVLDGATEGGGATWKRKEKKRKGDGEWLFRLSETVKSDSRTDDSALKKTMANE